MNRNENGVVVPGGSFILPLRVNTANGKITHITDIVGSTVAPVVYSIEMAEFLRESANYHERFAEIVKRLAELETFGERSPICELKEVAAELWQEYQKEGGYHEAK